MQIFCNCYASWKVRLLRFFHLLPPKPAIGRFVYQYDVTGGDKLIRNETYICNLCGQRLHIDTDWKAFEGGFADLLTDREEK